MESVDLWGGELAAQRGPLNVQSDIYLYQLNRLAKHGGDLASPLYWGGYVQVGYFLTGEHRPYKRSAGVFDRLRPYENFSFIRGEDGSLQRGLGAWELVARYGYLDLHSSGFATDPSDATRVGGTGMLQDITLGVNWVRCYRDSDGGPAFDGHVDIWAARVVLDF